jgi:hypothetical protein
MIRLQVNEQEHELAADPAMPLLWVLRICSASPEPSVAAGFPYARPVRCSSGRQRRVRRDRHTVRRLPIRL